MSYAIYQVDAFSSEPFRGNPAAVMPLDKWLEDELLQSIALENNLSETAFMVPVEDGFELRWFTPTVEVDLCGHATLATAHVLFDHLAYAGERICFHTRSGMLQVLRHDSGYTLDFPKGREKDGSRWLKIRDNEHLQIAAQEVENLALHGLERLILSC